MYGAGDVRVKLRPGGPREAAGVAQHLPELLGGVGGEWRDHHHKRIERLANTA